MTYICFSNLQFPVQSQIMTLFFVLCPRDEETEHKFEEYNDIILLSTCSGLRFNIY